MKLTMKISGILLVAILVLIAMVGCMSISESLEPEPQMQITVGTYPTETEATDETLPRETVNNQEDPTQPTHQETIPKETESVPEETEKQTEDKTPNKDVPSGTEPSLVPTVSPSTQPSPTKPQEETEPTVTDPTTAEPPKEENQKEDPPATELPESQPTVPTQTETAECKHDWECIRHAEEGHWVAGVVCDCGWTFYGNADEVVSRWNAHSSSYPTAESLFDHGGFGCIDEWIVDKPSYDEWVCRHCGERKP